MDLTKEYPRSVHDKYLGVVQLGRTIDKSKANLEGKLGEYHYNCPMDQAIFGFLGLDADKLTAIVKNAKSDTEIESALRPYVSKKSANDIENWNRGYVTTQPVGESLQYFTELRNQIAPGRTDVVSWPDLLDLDEKRTVPQRTAV